MQQIVCPFFNSAKFSEYWELKTMSIHSNQYTHTHPHPNAYKRTLCHLHIESWERERAERGIETKRKREKEKQVCKCVCVIKHVHLYKCKLFGGIHQHTDRIDWTGIIYTFLCSLYWIFSSSKFPFDCYNITLFFAVFISSLISSLTRSKVQWHLFFALSHKRLWNFDQLELVFTFWLNAAQSI